MRILRNGFIHKTISVFLLLIFLQSIIQPYYVFALTTGPHQPEYISYESPGATDMVNLLTGDFTYSLPILDVPGPEGGFSLPLTYHAGIGLEQESSWVGLGWTLNPGAITRTINEFPDDASGESHSIRVQDDGIRGWSSSLLGLGQAGWNTEQGHYGSVSFLGISWNNSGVSVDPVSLAMGLTTVISIVGAPASIAAARGGEAIRKTVALGLDLASVGTQMAKNLGARRIPNAPTAGNWEYSRKVKNKILYRDYWIWLDQTRVEDMLGVLYLQEADLETYSAGSFHLTPGLKIDGNSAPLKKFPKTGNNKGSASDISYYLRSGVEYEDATSPALMAFDDFSVKAPGIGGPIRPYRLDIGTVSMPRRMTKDHERLVPLPYQSYKVPFIYEGMASGNYFHHVGKLSGNIAEPSFYYGISKEVGSPIPTQNNSLTYNFDDVIFDDQRIGPSVSSTKKIPQANHIEYVTNEEIRNTSNGFANGYMDYFHGSERIAFRDQLDFGPVKSFYSGSATFGDNGVLTIDDQSYLAPSNFVDLEVVAYVSEEDWLNDLNGDSHSYSNVEVSGVDQNQIALDTTAFHTELTGKYCQVTVRTTIAPKMPKSIGGFSITGSDGMTYHFALPIYDYDNETLIVNKNDSGKKTTLKRTEPFASTWLLTGITGPDFVDRGGGTEGTDANGVIDDRDWGYWVKLNYGNAANDFKWRIPYDGTRRDPGNSSDMYSHGYKQLYYLNSIETRSHAAIFLKEVRQDSQGANDVASLGLKEIYLLSKEDYRKLTLSSPDGFGMTPVSGSIEELWMVNDFYNSQGVPLAQGAYITSHALKRIKFTHSYSLCGETPNSLASGKGKLTLERISILGRNEMKFHPDYIFEYGPNPDYGEHLWDAFGMYKADGTLTSHTATGDGTAWSMTRITTPMGATIDIQYERDTYSHVSEEPVEASYGFVGIGGNHYDDPYPRLVIDELHGFQNGTSELSVDQEVTISGTVFYNCPNPDPPVSDSFSGTYTIQEKTSSSITVHPPVFSITGCVGNVEDLEVEGTVSPLFVNKPGGNIRVASITLSDDFSQQQKLRYHYDNDDGSSSGVISREPEYAKNGVSYDFDTYPGYPLTPVLYGKVTVLSGRLSDDDDYVAKQVYEFQTPHSDMITPDEDVVEDLLVYAPGGVPFDRVKLVKNQIEDRTAEIGNLKSTKVYDAQDHLVSSTVYDYTDSISNPGDIMNNQGTYSDGTLMFDAVRIGSTSVLVNKVTRTTVLKYPSVLKKVTTSKDDFISVEENVAWDFLSGQPVEKIQISPLGLKTKAVSVPAYTRYGAMGSKALDVDNKNMLSQHAAEYSYKLNPNDSIAGIIGASATTWEDDVNGIWRKKKSYSWKGDYASLNSDGTRDFGTGDEFDFTPQAPNTGWQYLGEVTAYDNYSMPLESVDLNGIYASVRLGYDNQLKIAEASNAGYQDIAFSSAEDLDEATSSFGGDVLLKNPGDNNPEVTSSQAHTGSFSVSLSSGRSFVYKPASLATNRAYRASVWTSSLNGRIYYILNGGSEAVSGEPSPSMKVGDWYLLHFEVPVGSTFTSLEVGVKSTGGTTLFDDFRFQPLDAVLTTYVYDKITGELTHVLDNNNLFTRYEYDDAGRLKKTYAESLKYGVKLMSESKIHYKGFYINQ